MKQINFSVINLGCSKNTVDTEFVLGEILKLNSEENQINFFPDPEDKEVEYVIINTCGFLSSSRDEAEETIWYYDHIGKKVILIGCYVPVKDDKFLSGLKNLEAVVPYSEVKNVSEILIPHPNPLLGEERGQENILPPSPLKEKDGGGGVNLKHNLYKLKKDKLQSYLSKIGGDQINTKAYIYGSESVRAFLHADKGYEYLKIAEGCNNKCSFCIIPNIRGKQTSRTIEDILTEVKIMVDSGIKEIEIISQDTTRYGVDLYKAPKLLELLEEIDKLEGDFKIRLFYMYPDILSLSHIDRLANLKKLLPYFDFPFQHISPTVLKNMGRFYDDKHILKLLDYIKEKFNKPFLHTNFIVGFPGEKEDDFEQLLNFAKRYEFDSVSVFGYHDEPLADSSKLENKVDNKTIRDRLKRLKKVLNDIYDKKDDIRVGEEQVGYIDDIIDEKTLIVRPEIKAPEVDDYDKVKVGDVISGEFEIGSKIVYIYNP
ncbi:MAG: MiaB/RimO family radical SAM methylthiotransferase [Candidatus Gracilibacteria bacterium]|nr:MiaB/RimO family radical SAM methylthiotransferase [Candidatus Gracilibacteria bacterium]